MKTEKDWSLSQTDDEFDEILRSFENVIDNISQSIQYFVLITGDINAPSSSWWENNINNFEGINMENLTSSDGLKQLISKLTYPLPTSSSCVDLIFANHPNMVMNGGVFL